MDHYVLEAQLWYKTKYEQHCGPIPDDGKTSWASMYGMIRALQKELGIFPYVDSFGPTTMTRYAQYIGALTANSSSSHIQIYQAVLRLKGYSSGSIDGQFGSFTTAASASIKADLGIPLSAPLNARLMRSIMSMDAYVLLPGGSGDVRDGQRWINQWWNRSDYPISPTDGTFSRQTQKCVMFVVQYLIGMADGVANGNFGPGTKAGLQAVPTLSMGSTDAGIGKKWVSLLQALLNLYGYSGIPIDGSYSAAMGDTIRGFQEFAQLPITGTVTYDTWAELLVSTGNPDRAVTGFDTSKPLTANSAGALKGQGMLAVGRYLNGTSKGIKPGELETLKSVGLDLWVYYQEYNDAPQYFTRAIGLAQGRAAALRALHLRLPLDTTIFFPVDFDALESEVRGRVAEYFEGVRDGIAALSSPGARLEFKVGAYGARQTVSILHELGYIEDAVILGMSTGYAGNLGHQLPEVWRFNQIKQYPHVAAGIDVDHVVVRAGAPLIPSASLGPVAQRNGAFLATLRSSLSVGVVAAGIYTNGLQVGAWAWEAALANHFMVDDYTGTSRPEAPGWIAYGGLGVEVARYPPPGLGLTLWNTFEQAAIAAQEALNAEDSAFLAHMYAAASGLIEWGMDTPGAGHASLGDLGGWGLDLVTLWSRNYLPYSEGAPSPGNGVTPLDPNSTPLSLYDFIFEYTGKSGLSNGSKIGDLPWVDLVGDAMAYVWRHMRQVDDVPWSEALHELFTKTESDTQWLFREFVDRRFNRSAGACEAAVDHLFGALNPTIAAPTMIFGQALPGFAAVYLGGKQLPTVGERADIGRAFRAKLWLLAGL